MSAEITPERIARMRRYPCISDVDDLLDALESSRAEVQRLQRERDAAIDERNAWRSGDQDARIEADRLRAEVQRLTEESRRSDAGLVEVPELTCQNCAAKWCQFHGIPGRACSDHERLSPSPQPATGAEELESDDWRRAGLTPQQMWEEIQEIRELVGCDGTHGSPRDAVARKLDILRSSPQPATSPFGCCSRCGGVMELSAGWLPSYGNPDNIGGDPMAWPYCPKCDASSQPSADVVVRPVKEIPDRVPCGHPGCLHHVSHPCEGCGRVAGRSADVVVVPRVALESAIINTQRTPKNGDAYDSLIDAIRSSTNNAQDAGEGR